MRPSLLDPEDLDERGVLKDGKSVSIPLHLMDETQRAVAAAAITDGRGNVAGHRPGFVVRVGDADPARDAWEEHQRRLVDAWRRPSPLVLSPTPPARVAPPARARKITADEAREERDRWLRDAWKGGSR